MDLRFTDDELAFRDEVQQFFRTAVPADLRRKCVLGQRLSKPELQRWTPGAKRIRWTGFRRAMFRLADSCLVRLLPHGRARWFPLWLPWW